ncbi:MAG: transcription termination factor Rho [Lachnospiraceae bacterium]|nr:transcription termination factor Rho [Candidatus Colinaster scatohippi]
MTREMYESLAIADLKAIAKTRGIKGTSKMVKAEVIEAMLELDMAQAEASADKTQAEASANGTQAEASANGTQAEALTDRVASVGENLRTTEARKTPARNQPQEVRRSKEFSQPQEARRSKEVSQPQEVSQSQEMQVENKEKNDAHRELDSGQVASGILEVMSDGFGFIRSANYLPGENDVYVAPSQIRKFGLKTGDIICGNTRVKAPTEKFSALLYLKTINGYSVEEAVKRYNFEDMTPIFPNERIHLAGKGSSNAMRIMDLLSPVGKGQRGMIVSPPKAGKTTLLKEVAKSVLKTNPEIHLIVLLIDERPEEVTDIMEAITGDNVEVIYSTFDELPEHHKRVSEMTIERAKRLVEHNKDVMILIDSITRLTRAYNLTVPPSGRTLSGGLDPAALHMPKKFFGAARNMREGGSLTILATALVETGSKMDDVVYEEFKGTGNMEMVLDRKLSEKRIFPAIDMLKSGTRRDDLLLSPIEIETTSILRKGFNGMKPEEVVDRVLEKINSTKDNSDFCRSISVMKYI